METYTSCSGGDGSLGSTRRHDRKHIFNDSLINCGFLLECGGTFPAFRLALLSELSRAARFLTHAPLHFCWGSRLHGLGTN
jgi:hypothetical protein